MDFFQGYQIDILCLYWAPFLKQRGPIEPLNVFYDYGSVCGSVSGLGSLGDAGFEDFGSLEEPSLNKLAVLGRAAPSFCCFCY